MQAWGGHGLLPCRRCSVHSAPPSLHGGLSRHSCQLHTPLWQRHSQLTACRLCWRVRSAAGSARATATVQQPHAEPEEQAGELSAGEEVRLQQVLPLLPCMENDTGVSCCVYRTQTIELICVASYTVSLHAVGPPSQALQCLPALAPLATKYASLAFVTSVLY